MQNRFHCVDVPEWYHPTALVRHKKNAKGYAARQRWMSRDMELSTNYPTRLKAR